MFKLIQNVITPSFVIPAKAGIQRGKLQQESLIYTNDIYGSIHFWIPASAGMTKGYEYFHGGKRVGIVNL